MKGRAMLTNLRNDINSLLNRIETLESQEELASLRIEATIRQEIGARPQG